MDYISQPSRAVLAFLLFNKIPHQLKEIRVFKGEHFSEEYLKINPFGKVPTIMDSGFSLQESHAILRYLAKSRSTPDNWYPKDPKKSALVDAYLDWHHTNTRRATVYVIAVQKKRFPDQMFPADPDYEEEKKALAYTLKMLDTFWLKDGKFMTGLEEISIADLSACCELMQLQFIGFDFAAYPKVNSWMKTMMEFKEMQQAHETFYKLKKVMDSRKPLPKL